MFGGKDKRYDGVFFKERDVLKGIILNVTLPYEELEEVAYGPDIGVNRVFLQFDMTFSYQGKIRVETNASRHFYPSRIDQKGEDESVLYSGNTPGFGGK